MPSTPLLIRHLRRHLRRRLDWKFEEAMRHQWGSRLALRRVVIEAVKEGVAAGIAATAVEEALRTYFAEHPARLAFDRPSLVTNHLVFDQIDADITKWAAEASAT